MSLWADLSGAVSGGQVVVGEYGVRIHAEHGAVLDYASPEVRPVPVPRVTPPSSPPRDLRLLLGREEELRAVGDTLGPGARLEIVGEAGIGKTALLRHLANRHAGRDELGSVLFLGAAGQPGEDLLQLLFEGFYECDGAIVPTVPELKRYLQDRRGLVVLDDADLARRELERVVSLAPGCAFAIGSGERRLWGGGRSIALKGMDEQSCLALAERELARSLTDHERASLGRLVLALEGHPLRIVQAARLMIQRRRARSDRAAPSGSPREQFDELVARSVEGDEERVLGPLAAFPGVALEASRLADITDMPDAQRVLASLEERCVVRAQGKSYSLAGTVSAAIGRRMDLGAWRDRTLEHYSHEEGIVSAVEAPAILALLEAGAKAGKPRTVIQLARNASAPLALGTRWGAWREALEHALAAAREIRDQRTEAWALHQLGSRAICLGDLRGATALLNDALRLREGLGDEEGARLTRHNLEALEGGPPTPTAPPAGPPTPTPAPPATPTPAPPTSSTVPPRELSEQAPPPAATAPPRPKPTLRDRPPLKPVIAVIVAVVLLVAIVLAVSGGDEESPTQRGETEQATDANPGGNRPEPRSGGGGGGKRPQALAAVIEPKALRFTALVDRLSRPLIVRAENRGAARITLGQVRLEGTDRADFVLTDGCRRSTLSRGERCTVVVSFVPSGRQGVKTRARTARLIFTDDGRDGRQTVSLTGSVTPP